MIIWEQIIAISILNFQKKWKKFNFLKLDLNDPESLEKLKSFNPNFYFINGAIHHLDDKQFQISII